MQNKRKIGTEYESRVADYLTARGYRLLHKNFRCRFGEVDLVAEKGGCIHFVEVKYRTAGQFGDGAESVDGRKQQRISNVASYYLYCYHYPTDTACCFDVASVTPGKIHYIENAFTYAGKFTF